MSSPEKALSLSGKRYTAAGKMAILETAQQTSVALTNFAVVARNLLIKQNHTRIGGRLVPLQSRPTSLVETGRNPVLSGRTTATY